MRLVVLVASLLVAAAAWAAAAPPGSASCARTAGLEELAGMPRVAVFTGAAAGEAPGSTDILFAVDRWYQGPHAAQVVRILGYTATLSEPPAGGVVGVALAEVVAGDAITLVEGEPVVMVATWDGQNGGFAVYFCSVAGVPLDSAEGRDAVRTAESVFGGGRGASNLPATDTIAAVVRPDRGGTPLLDWWPVVTAFAAAATIVHVWRRIDATPSRHPG